MRECCSEPTIVVRDEDTEIDIDVVDLLEEVGAEPDPAFDDDTTGPAITVVAPTPPAPRLSFSSGLLVGALSAMAVSLSVLLMAPATVAAALSAASHAVVARSAPPPHHLEASDVRR
jgi:hypothetical protein